MGNKIQNQSLDRSILVGEYNDKVNQHHPQDAIVVDTNQNGQVDTGDRFFHPEKGELDGRAKSQALNKMCDIMATQKTKLKINSEAREYLEGRNSFVENGVNSQTLLLRANVTLDPIPVQSFGIFDENTNQCRFNAGDTVITKTENGIRLENQDHRGKIVTDINMETSDWKEFVKERVIKP